MKFQLTIEGDVSELADIASVLEQLGGDDAGGEPTSTDTGNSPAPARRGGRKSNAQKAAEAEAARIAAAQQSSTVASGAGTQNNAAPSPSTPETAAPPAASQPGQPTPVVDPVTAAQNGAVGATSPTPAAGSPGQPTYDQLKDVMVKVMEATSAADAQQCIKDGTGGAHQSLTTLFQNNPEMAGAVLAKLNARLLG